MTNRQIKEIYIDGVDVSKCEFYDAQFCNLSNDRNEQLPFAVVCSEYSNCLYKQLKAISKENDDCKKRLNKLHDFNKKIIYKNFKIACQNTKRKQALDDIEKYTIEQFCDNCEDIGSTELTCHCEYCEYGEIFDIINKAKEE